MLLSVFEGVPQSEVPADVIKAGTGILEFLAESTNIFASKGEARRMIKDNAVSVNKEKVKDEICQFIKIRDALNNIFTTIENHNNERRYFENDHRTPKQRRNYH